MPLGLDPALPPDTAWHPVDRLPTPMAFDHGSIVPAGRERLRAKLSYTNIGFALAPERFSFSELSEIYSAALGHPVDPTNLRRVLERRGLLEATGERPTFVPRLESKGIKLPSNLFQERILQRD